MSDKHKEVLMQVAEAIGETGEFLRERRSAGMSDAQTAYRTAYAAHLAGDSAGPLDKDDLGRILGVLESSSLNWLLEDRDESRQLLTELEARLERAVRDAGRDGSS